MARPNIIFYFSDQQRADTITEELTPNLCALAGEGIKYDNNFTCQPVCGPARACIQTGVYGTENGCHINGIAVKNIDNNPLLAEIFKENGYNTAYVGKWHLATDKFKMGGVNVETTAIPPVRRKGYDFWRAADVLEFTSHGYDGYVFDENGNKCDFKGYRADCINDYALEFLDKTDKNQPFFMFVSQIEPHQQNDRNCYEGYKPTVESYKNHPIPDDLNFLRGNYNKHYPDYLSQVNRLDYNVGKLVAKLEELGIADNTIILYTSDHGCHFKTRNLEYKRSCHHSATHTPLIIKGGEFAGGKVEKRLTSLIDIPPTLLQMAGIAVPSHYRGEPLQSFVADSKKKHDAVYMEISESQVGRAIITEKYTYAVKSLSPFVLKKSASFYFDNFLYDNEADPNQKVNLIRSKKHKDIVREMRMKLKEKVREVEGKSVHIFNKII
ncbi:MAG: sulfatase-like hydrolase/transferase [Bacillota bacterium]